MNVSVCLNLILQTEINVLINHNILVEYDKCFNDI